MAQVIELSSPPSSSESEQPDLDIDELKGEISECLDGIHTIGTFALFENLDAAPNPGLYLKSGGIVGLPLSDRDAEAVIAASHEAPFGKGEETIIDKSVRKAWELSSTNFELRNPAWPGFVQSIVAKVSAGLGVSAAGNGVSAHLYKMLLYDEGAMFKPHQDSEKAPGMFATLVITLPSKHEGGDVKLSHGGETKVFETSKHSDYGSSYLTWFSDVTHEVRPVLSGHRLVLTYNLVHETLDSKVLAAGAPGPVDTLKSLLHQWNKSLWKETTYQTAYMSLFEHHYTDSNLHIDHLKGHDRDVATCMLQAGNESNFCFYLANLERTVIGSCEDTYDDWEDGFEVDEAEFHPMIEEIEKSLHLGMVIDRNGIEVARNMAVVPDHFFYDDSFLGFDPDDEDYSGPTGNEGVSTTHFYHRTIAMLVPKAFHIDFFLNPSFPGMDLSYNNEEELMGYTDRASEWLARLKGAVLANPSDIEARQDLENACTVIGRETTKARMKALNKQTPVWARKKEPFSDDVLESVTRASIAIDNKCLFEEAFLVWPHEPTPSMLQDVGKSLVRYNLDSYLATISERLSAINKLSTRVESIHALQTGYITKAKLLSKPVTVIQDWVRSEMDTALTSTELSTVEDGAMLSTLIKTSPQDIIFNTILPAVKRNIGNSLMAMAFIAGVVNAGLKGEIDTNLSQSLAKDVLSDLASDFNWRPVLRSVKGVDVFGASALFFANSPSSTLDGPEIVQIILGLITTCIFLDCLIELSDILEKLAAVSSNQSSEMHKAFFIPLLHGLCRHLKYKGTSVLGTPHQGFFQKVLRNYIAVRVGAEPKPPTNWSRPRTTCSCIDCSVLNSFLVNPSQQEGRFAVNKERRHHLQVQLNNMGGFTHVTERIGSPQTLVVTKTQSVYLAASRDWQKKRAAAMAQLQVFDETMLRELLSEQFDAIMSLSVPQPSQPSSWTTHTDGRIPLSSVMNPATTPHVLPPISRRKIPASTEVVDLT